jgi:16S rRNA (guanine966-N2)-methyltransferase
MRVIAGTYRGRHLKASHGANLRPTSDQLRETLFDVLGPGVSGSRFLDAYAGTGSVGIEALSRGASEVVFIERHRRAADLIHANLERLGIHSGYLVMACKVETGLERLASQSFCFQYVFLDPPYSEIREYHHVLRQLGRSPLIGPESWVIAEHSRHCYLEERYGNLARTRTLRHGDAQLSFYRLI